MAGRTGNKIKITPEIIKAATEAVINGIIAKARSDKERRAASEPRPTPTDLRIGELTETVAGLVRLASQRTPRPQPALNRIQDLTAQTNIASAGHLDGSYMSPQLAHPMGNSTSSSVTDS
jgi:hypothetical protein